MGLGKPIHGQEGGNFQYLLMVLILGQMRILIIQKKVPTITKVIFLLLTPPH